MLKNLTIYALIVLLLYSQAFSQETKKDLTEKALTLYQQGKYEKAIEAAERVVQLEKANQSQDTASYVNSLINAARMKQGYIIDLQSKIADKNRFVREKIELSEKSSQIAAEVETLLRQALQLNESGGRAQTAQTADVKSELAMLVDKYNPSVQPSIENSRGRIDEAEKLLSESLALNERVRGKDDDKTLSVVLQTGDFYLRYVNFEKALPFYERYLQTVEKKGAKNYPETISALRSYASLLHAGFQEKESAEAIAKLEAITQKKEAEFPAFNLQVRSKDAVAYNYQVLQGFRTENESFKSRLKLQGKTLNRSAAESAPRVLRVPVRVVVDEDGKIIEAVADEKDEKLRARAVQQVSKWIVRPLSYNGAARKMRGTLTYTELK